MKLEERSTANTTAATRAGPAAALPPSLPPSLCSESDGRQHLGMTNRGMRGMVHRLTTISLDR